MEIATKSSICSLLFAAVLFWGIPLVVNATPEEVLEAAPDSPDFSGVADYYADYFHGKRTASGQLHDMGKLTAAHLSLPFGTKVKLVNRRSKRSCIVVINDRGPYTKNRIIDVSKEAANKLGLFSGSRKVDCYIVSNQRTAAR